MARGQRSAGVSMPENLHPGGAECSEFGVGSVESRNHQRRAAPRLLQIGSEDLHRLDPEESISFDCSPASLYGSGMMPTIVMPRKLEGSR